MTLEDGDATRNNTNVDIKSGNALVAYFAGHSTRVKASGGWETQDVVVEVICPGDEFLL